jgi:hypothetical protein
MEAVIVDYRSSALIFFKSIVHTHTLTPIKTESKNDANPAAPWHGEPIILKLQIPNYNVQNYKQLRHVICRLSSVFCLLSSHLLTFLPSQLLYHCPLPQ